MAFIVLCASYLIAITLKIVQAINAQEALGQYCTLTDQLTTTLVAYERAKQNYITGRDYNKYAADAMEQLTIFQDLLSNSSLLMQEILSYGFAQTQLMQDSLQNFNYIDSLEISENLLRMINTQSFLFNAWTPVLSVAFVVFIVLLT